MQYVGEFPDDERLIYLFPHPLRGNSNFILFEDDGISNKYKDGDYSKIIIEMNALPDLIVLQVRYLNHGYPLTYPSIEFILPENEKRPVKINDIKYVNIYNQISFPVSAII